MLPTIPCSFSPNPMFNSNRAESDVQLEPRRRVLRSDSAHADAGPLQRLHRRVLHGECHLEQGRVTHVTLGPQVFDEHLERHILMYIATQTNFAHALEELASAFMCLQLRPQHQAVHEESDQPL